MEGTASAAPPADVPSAAAQSSDTPARARGVELLGELPGSGYREPPALARRSDGQTIQLTPLLYLVLEAIDGQRSCDKIAARVGAASGRRVTGDDVRMLVDDKLRPLGLLQLPDGSEPAVAKTNPLLGLRFRYVVTDPAVTRRICAPFVRLLNPVVVLAVLAAFAAVCGWVFFEKGLASATYHAFDEPGLLLLVFGITVVSAGFHEVGHAAAARYGGAAAGAMGTGLYLVWPAFYTDVTDSYRLGRAGRVRTDLGGLYFNAIVAVCMFAVWAATDWDALLLVIATQVLQMVRQLAPLVRFDGYHVLADLTGVPDLYRRIGPTLLGLLPSRWSHPEAKVLKPWARAVVTAWVVLVVPIMLLCLLLIVIAMPRVLATAWASLGRQWAMLGEQFSSGDVASVLVRLLSIVAIALPVLGIGYLLARIVRRVAQGTWRATEGKPVRRALAGVTATAVLASLTLVWWPDSDTYRPIQPYERGTVLDALPAVGRTSVGLEEGRGGTARTVWPAGTDLPSADRPELALVLVPRSHGADRASTEQTSAEQTAESDPAVAPTWVFPFNRPLPPGDGDNQALAVNTQDGSTLYDVAFALVWADGGSVTNSNEAYAFASCTDCRTVAVSFQVILVLGQANIVVPQNIAAAVNYMCLECVTFALATQLVLTVSGPLSEAASAELAALWEEIRQFAENIEDFSLSALQSRLTEFEVRILDIIREDAGTAVTQSSQDDEGTAPGGAEPGSSESGSSDTTQDAGSAGSTTQDPTPTTGATSTGSSDGTEPASTPTSTSSTTSSTTSTTASPTVDATG